MRGTLTGNRAALEKNYLLHLSGTSGKWMLTLLPSEREDRRASSSASRSAGSRDQIRSIEYLQADGDRSLMLIEALDSR